MLSGRNDRGSGEFGTRPQAVPAGDRMLRLYYETETAANGADGPA
jgi:hypothetical protein